MQGIVLLKRMMGDATGRRSQGRLFSGQIELRIFCFLRISQQLTFAEAQGRRCISFGFLAVKQLTLVVVGIGIGVFVVVFCC